MFAGGDGRAFFTPGAKGDTDYPVISSQTGFATGMECAGESEGFALGKTANIRMMR